MSGVSKSLVVWVGGREGGAWWLPAGGIRASQGTFSSFLSSEMNLKLLGKKLYNEIEALLWLTLNYKDFCTGITEEMKSCKAD